ncbi:MAG: DUF5127 domain-containing protein [Planctomycetes bacterium]|nr:DUF5127 domain-containing protein [Planctomycetota bacterium]
MPALPTARTLVTATRTTFEYAHGPVGIELAFVTPALPDDLEVLSRPLTYVVFTAVSRDGAEHSLDFQFAVPCDVCIDHPGRAVAPTSIAVDGLDAAGFRSEVSGSR